MCLHNKVTLQMLPWLKSMINMTHRSPFLSLLKKNIESGHEELGNEFHEDHLDDQLSLSSHEISNPDKEKFDEVPENPDVVTHEKKPRW